MVEAFQEILSKTQWPFDQYAKTVRKTGEEQFFFWINAISKKLGEAQEIIDMKAKVLQC